MSEISGKKQDTRSLDDRRQFLLACGRFAVVTPPAVTVLLSTSLTSGAIAASGSAGPILGGGGIGLGGGSSGGGGSAEGSRNYRVKIPMEKSQARPLNYDSGGNL